MPLSIEKQVLSIFVATSGAMDTVAVTDVRRFEREFLQFAEASYPALLKNIAEKKALDDAMRAEIKTAVDAFKERFTAAVAAAAN